MCAKEISYKPHIMINICIGMYNGNIYIINIYSGETKKNVFDFGLRIKSTRFDFVRALLVSYSALKYRRRECM